MNILCLLYVEKNVIGIFPVLSLGTTQRAPRRRLPEAGLLPGGPVTAPAPAQPSPSPLCARVLSGVSL